MKNLKRKGKEETSTGGGWMTNGSPKKNSNKLLWLFIGTVLILIILILIFNL